MIIVTQVRNESKRLIEWLKYHKQIIGIEEFFVFDDNSSDDTFELLNSLSVEYNIKTFKTEKNGKYVESTNPNVYGTSELHNRIKSSMNNGLLAIKKNKKNIGKWCFFIEVDEFLKEDVEISTYLKTIPSDINRLWIPSYDFNDNFDLEKNILPQTQYRWSDKTRDNSFIGRCKSALRVKEYDQIIIDIHNLDNSKCIRTSGFKMNDDANMVRQDTYGLKLFHYRKPSLLNIFDFFDDSMSQYDL